MYPRLTQILLIDGDPRSFESIAAPLNGRGYKVEHTRTAREGLNTIYRNAPDLILVSRDLMDMDGLHFCSELKNDVVMRYIPIILLDPDPLLDTEISSREFGADDYLSKPVNVEELDGRIRQIFRLGTLGINSHPVTGLPGYNTVYRKIQETLYKEGPYAVVFMDIHGFRRFNQVYGYEKGDEILGATARLVSRILQSRQRYLDFFGHMGSDDFVLITDPDTVEELCSEIIERFEWSFPDISTPADQELGDFDSQGKTRDLLRFERIYLSLAILTQEAGRPIHVAQMIEKGMELLASAKKGHKSRWVKQEKNKKVKSLSLAGAPAVMEGKGTLLNGGVHDKTNGRLSERIQRFRELIQAGSLELHFQPILYLDSEKTFGYEALLRGPSGSSLESPVILFSLARRLDLEQELDLICLNKLRELADGVPKDKKIFFNVSPASFFNPRFRECFDKAREDLSGERMVLEVIRKRRIHEFQPFRESIGYFKKRGCQVAVDDVKAGTLSLRTILELLPDYIKADVSVIRNIHKEPSKQRLFQRYGSFCDKQNITLISEGVESELERDYLLEQGAKLGQGFFFSHPQPLAV